MTTITSRIRKRDGQLVWTGSRGQEEAVAKRLLRPMTGEEIEAAALTDLDNPPRTADQLRATARTPRAKIIRRALGLTQEEFAARYQIPLGTLRDWEQGRSEPDQPARAYLKVIARDPDTIGRLLHMAAE